MAIIHCIHGDMMEDTPHSSFQGTTILVKTRCHFYDRVIFHREDGQIDVSPYRLRTHYAESPSLNPFCTECANDFLDLHINDLDIDLFNSHLALRDLRDHVRQVLNLEVHNEVELIVFHVDKLREWHTDVPEIYADWTDQDEEVAMAHAPPNKPGSLEALERVNYEDMVREGSTAWKEDNCAICLEGLGPAATKEEQPEVSKLPCQHAFHKSCIVEWLSCNHVCPLCRFELPRWERDSQSTRE